MFKFLQWESWMHLQESQESFRSPMKVTKMSTDSLYSALKIPTASGLILDSISLLVCTAGYKFYLTILGIIQQVLLFLFFSLFQVLFCFSSKTSNSRTCSQGLSRTRPMMTKMPARACSFSFVIKLSFHGRMYHEIHTHIRTI